MAKERRMSTKEKKAEYAASQQAYFEAILQLRREYTEEQFNEIVDHIEESTCRISKHVIRKEGIDLFLTSQKYIQQLGRWMKDRYSCQITSTRKLHTRDVIKCKDLYRVTVCAKFFKFKVGDIINYRGEDVKISSTGEKISGKVLSSGKRIFLDEKLIE